MAFPDVQSRLQKRLSKIDVDPACVPNNQLIRRFANDCLVVGLGPVRVHKYLYHLKWMAKWLGKDFREVDENGIRALVGKIETSSFAANTKRDFRIAIKKLFSWLSEVGESQVSTDWIKTGKGANHIIIPSNLLTVENIPQVLRACETIQERALASFLYDTGCRVEELLNVKMKDVEIMKDFARVRLDGKTGPRPGYAITWFPELRPWLESHPNPDDPEAALWVSSVKKRPLSYASCSQTLWRIKKRSGLKKAMYPHAYRHARATELASVLTEAQMCQFFGWQLGSKMPRVYVHMSGRDLEGSLLEHFGSHKQANGRATALPCINCGSAGPAGSHYCSQCGSGLAENGNGRPQMDSKHANVDSLISQALASREVRRILEEKLKELTSPSTN